MGRHFTRNHIVVEDNGDEQYSLNISDFLRRELGEPVEFRFAAVGVEIAVGQAYGRVDGAHQGCHLFAPFSMVLNTTDAASGAVEVSRKGPGPRGLLNERDYSAKTASSR